jgi:uncharacterized membrane protein
MTVSQFGIAWVSSGNIMVGVWFIGYTAIVNSLIFYVHERIWNRVAAGKEILT